MTLAKALSHWVVAVQWVESISIYKSIGFHKEVRVLSNSIAWDIHISYVRKGLLELWQRYPGCLLYFIRVKVQREAVELLIELNHIEED